MPIIDAFPFYKSQFGAEIGFLWRYKKPSAFSFYYFNFDGDFQILLKL